jgi:hypothetical protein
MRDLEVKIFNQFQIIMYEVPKDHLNSVKGVTLDGQYKGTSDAQRIYRDVMKHALGATAAQLTS